MCVAIQDIIIGLVAAVYVSRVSERIRDVNRRKFDNLPGSNAAQHTPCNILLGSKVCEFNKAAHIAVTHNRAARVCQSHARD